MTLKSAAGIPHAMNKLTIAISLALVFIVTFLAFLPSLGSGFVNWDDYAYVVDNPHIKSLTAQNLWHSVSAFSLGAYTPLVFISYLSDYHIFKLDPFGYHLVNVVLHASSSAFVFWLIYMLGGSVSAALITALLFGIHPMHVESVAWVSERKDVLYAFFFLGAIISYLYYLKKENARKWYYCALVFFILALLAKAMAVTLPLVLLLVGYFMGKKHAKPLVRDLIPFFLALFGFAVIAVCAHYSGGYRIEKDIISFFHKGFIAAYSLCFYLNKLFFPVNLSCLYPYPNTGSFFKASFLALPLMCLLLAIAGTSHPQQRSKWVFGILFFLITLLPALQFVQVGRSVVADRYTYVPSIGIFFLIGDVFARALGGGKQRVMARGLLLVSLIVGMGTLFRLTHNRVMVWKDSVSLWSDVLHKYPDAIAYNNRCAAYKDAGKFDLAISDCARAVQLYPQYAAAYNNRGLAYQAKGSPDEALSDYNRALQLEPSLCEAYLNRGIIQFGKGNIDDAVVDADKALQCNPFLPKAYNSRGIAYQNKGDSGKAIADFKEALRIDPGFAEAYVNLGVAFYAQGRLPEALLEYESAIKTNPGFALAYYNRGLVYHHQGDLEKALSDYTQAITINPAYAKAYYNRGISYFLIKEYNKSYDDVQRAVSLGYQANPELIHELNKALGRQP